MIDDDQMNEFIKKVAGNVARSFPSYVEADDVTSALWVWFLDKEDTVREMITDNPESWEAMLYGTMVRVASTHAAQTEADYHGYSVDDVYHYTTPVVKELLRDAFDYEDWQSFSTFGDGQPKSKRQTPTSDRVDMLVDVKSATEKLNDDQYNLILWRFKYGFQYDQIATSIETTPDTARKRVERAVKAVQKNLGKKSFSDMRNGWDAREKLYATEGERRNLSNAQALAYQESIY